MTDFELELLDKFASLAMQSKLINYPEINIKKLTKSSYEVAEAMIYERRNIG